MSVNTSGYCTQSLHSPITLPTFQPYPFCIQYQTTCSFPSLHVPRPVRIPLIKAIGEMRRDSSPLNNVITRYIQNLMNEPWDSTEPHALWFTSPYSAPFQHCTPRNIGTSHFIHSFIVWHISRLHPHRVQYQTTCRLSRLFMFHQRSICHSSNRFVQWESSRKATTPYHVSCTVCNETPLSSFPEIESSREFQNINPQTSNYTRYEPSLHSTDRMRYMMHSMCCFTAMCCVAVIHTVFCSHSHSLSCTFT